ncbi:gamma-glutamylcyclotransferase family protein [Marinospirillum perlucidum]|uniref:gamma-glutamylcyclotransferase family protein n=1 Tax=Marinospirillum perlucidum TaxID=1982602 RepID=UPI000DF199B6|nr:gamma-glutamylcyclotransferase family protein [Marinospirillum perlucidum]
MDQSPKKSRLTLTFSKLLATVTGLLLVAVLGAWLVWQSPWFYQPPPANQPALNTPQQVFVYGTLTWDWLRFLILRGPSTARDAQLPGYQKKGLDLEPEPGSRVQGQVLTVSPQELARLDRYERLGIKYQRQLKTLADGSQAWVYQLLSPPAEEEQP